MKKYLAIEKWTDDYDGSAIYSLVDRKGKRYIGQASKLQRRLESHRIALNNVKRGGNGNPESEKLCDAVRNGETFTVEILRKIAWCDATVSEMRQWESYYLDQYGGCENTYNTSPVPSPNYEYEKDNCITLAIDLEKDIYNLMDGIEDKQEYIKELIREQIKQD